MNCIDIRRALAALVFLGCASQLQGQPDEPEEREDVQFLAEILVTGSRIQRSPVNDAAPLLNISQADLNDSGLTSLSAALQQLPMAGSALNTRFNVPGNSGFPQDGSGIGAGSAQVSLRNLGAKRTLVLVDGRRWIAGASASGVPGTVDLNSLPTFMVERVEVLKDGASSIYGSDAISGVVNIITKRDFEGLRISVQNGHFLSYDDGDASQYSLLWGGGRGASQLLMGLGYTDEQAVFTSDRRQSAFPNPYGRGCQDGGCSSFTPQGRFLLGPNFGYADLTLNDGALNDGAANLPRFDPEEPYGGDFHAFASNDRFNFNGNRFNFLLTPNRRLHAQIRASHEFSGDLRLSGLAHYARRRSTTMGAPEPLCLGNGCGNAILKDVVIAADQRYNPFGAELSTVNGNLEFFGRRPLESGPRVFDQEVETHFFSGGLEGNFKSLSWNLGFSYGENQGSQRKLGAHNAAKLVLALGDPAICEATPGCAPFNFFGGQGPAGQGSITREMLDFVGYIQRDFSEQTLEDYTGNLSGDILMLPAGPLAFAAGFEYRRHRGRFDPDPIAARGETAGIPSAPTQGGFQAAEFYGELQVPLRAEHSAGGALELSAALRRSDYSTSGAENTYKVGLLWRPVAQLSLRGSVSTGFRAPGIGELFGGAAREDFAFLDPCADVLGRIGLANGGRDVPQPRNIADNCAALGLPPDLIQRNPQLSAVSAGNEALSAETSASSLLGLSYRPAWSDAVDWIDELNLSLDYYQVEIEDAIQGRNPGDIVAACVGSLQSFFCDAVQRSGRGAIELVDNRLQNIGGIEAAGADLALAYRSPPTRLGQFGFRLNATWLREYLESLDNPDGTLSVSDFTGVITGETFQRAFPEKRYRAALDYAMGAWGAGLNYRHVSNLKQASGQALASRAYLDLRIQYRHELSAGGVTATLGVNNLLDRDPAECESCGLIGMSPVAHDLPGRIGYLRLTLEL